jgi:hypothetical protein
LGTIRVVDLFALAAGAIVVAAHYYAGVTDVGHAVWRPVGHGTVLVMYAWLVAIFLSAVALISARGKSLAAGVTIAVTITSIVLLLSQ